MLQAALTATVDCTCVPLPRGAVARAGFSPAIRRRAWIRVCSTSRGSQFSSTAHSRAVPLEHRHGEHKAFEQRKPGKAGRGIQVRIPFAGRVGFAESSHRVRTANRLLDD